MGVGINQVVAGETIGVHFKEVTDSWGLALTASSQLFPLTFKGDSTISNPRRRSNTSSLGACPTLSSSRGEGDAARCKAAGP